MKSKERERFIPLKRNLSCDASVLSIWESVHWLKYRKDRTGMLLSLICIV
jgi:hypothetical protein